MQSDEESILLLHPEQSLEKKRHETHPRSGRVSAAVVFVGFLCLGFLGYSGTAFLESGGSLGSHIRHSSLSVTDVLSTTQVTETATTFCSKLFSASLSDLKSDLRSCKQSLDEGASIGATVPFCMGSSNDCKEQNADNVIIGTARGSGSITPDAVSQALEVSGNFGLGSFLYVIGNVLGGKGSTLRSLIGEVANTSLDGTLTVELETNSDLETGLTVRVVGAISVENDISCKDPLSCTLYQLVSDSARRSDPQKYSKLGGLDFSYKLTIENLDKPAEWEVEVSAVMAGVTIVKNKAWLKDNDGLGPSLYVKLAPEDPPAIGIFMPLVVCVQNCKSEGVATNLNFVGRLQLDGVTMDGTLKFNSWWKEALGIPILHLGHLQVGLTVAQANPTAINAISIGGRVCLGKATACVPTADGTLADGLSIAGAAYMGVNFNPEKSDDNYVFVAITETNLEKILQIFEDGMNFPNLRDSIPPPLLESTLLPYKTKTCKPEQEADFVNNLDCFATMSFSPGGDVELTPVLVVSQGTSVSARVDFMGSQMQMKLGMNTDPENPYLNMVGSTTPIKVMNVMTLTKSKGDLIGGPGVKMNCNMNKAPDLKCVMTGSGYIRIPALALTGNFAMTVKPQLPSSMITTIDFSSKMFGQYDMNVQATYNGPRATFLDLEISLSASGRTALANAMGKLAKEFLKSVDALTSDGQDFADGVSKSLKGKCKDVNNKKFSVGPVSVGGYKMKKRFKFDLNLDWPFDFIKFDKTWEHTWGDKIEFIPKLETSVRDECENYAKVVSVPFQQTVNGLLSGLNSLAKEATSAFKMLSDASKFFVMNKFTFAVHFDAANAEADMLLDLNMVVSKIPVVLSKFKVKQDADLARIIYDQVIKQAFPGLQNQLSEMQGIVNNMSNKITAKAKDVANSATQLFNNAVDVLTDKAEDAEKKVADKLKHYKNKCKDWLEDQCKDTVNTIIPKELGGCGWCKKKCSEAFD
jgi:hypothetical protein